TPRALSVEARPATPPAGPRRVACRPARTVCAGDANLDPSAADRAVAGRSRGPIGDDALGAQVDQPAVQLGTLRLEDCDELTEPVDRLGERGDPHVEIDLRAG